jgi:hypothetical protein
MINRNNNQYMQMILAKHNKNQVHLIENPTTPLVGRIEVVTIPTSGIVESDGKQYINKCCFNAVYSALMNTNPMILSKISELQMDVSPITLMRVANFLNDDEMINTDNVLHYIALCKIAEYLDKLDVRIHVYLGVLYNNKWYTNPTTDIIFGHGQYVIRIMNQIIYREGKSIGVHFEAIKNGAFLDDIVNMEHLIETQKEMDIIIHDPRNISEIYKQENYPDLDLLMRQQQIETHEFNMRYQREYQQLKQRHVCEKLKYEEICEQIKKKKDEQLARDEEFARRTQLEEDEAFAKKLEIEINK